MSGRPSPSSVSSNLVDTVIDRLACALKVEACWSVGPSSPYPSSRPGRLSASPRPGAGRARLSCSCAAHEWALLCSGRWSCSVDPGGLWAGGEPLNLRELEERKAYALRPSWSPSPVPSSSCSWLYPWRRQLQCGLVERWGKVTSDTLILYSTKGGHKILGASVCFISRRLFRGYAFVVVMSWSRGWRRASAHLMAVQTIQRHDGPEPHTH